MIRKTKLTAEQFERSLDSDLDHLWVYNKRVNDRKVHNYGQSLNGYTGDPIACIVVSAEFDASDANLSKIFGKGSFLNGSVTSYDKEEMTIDAYYLG